jgi:hypothetical protein
MHVKCIVYINIIRKIKQTDKYNISATYSINCCRKAQ